MAELMAEDELRRTALEVLESELGPLEAMRFLALVRREPFDYQAWRSQALESVTTAELFRQMQAMEYDAANGT